MTSFFLFLLGGFAFGGVATILGVWARKRFASFSAQRPSDYTNTDELFDIQTHLSGALICEGVIYGPTGRVKARFFADITGRWDAASGPERTGTLEEVFHYQDGSQQHRKWHLTLSPDGKISARADDIMGEGRGMQQADAVLMQYRYKLPLESGGHVLDVVDWMYLTPNGTIVNRSQFRKFGIKVAELVATIRPAKQGSKAEL